MQIVSPNDTVPCKVQYQQRKFTDVIPGIINMLMYVAFLVTGLIVVSRSSHRHVTLSDGTRGLSDYYMDDAATCCAANANQGYVCTVYLDTIADGGRRLSAGSSKFDGDEGIFDAFTEAPMIIVGLLSIVQAVAIIWAILLRYFAKPIVIFVEILKIVAVIAFAIMNRETTTRVICGVVAAAMIGYLVYTWKSIIFAAKIITHSTVSMKENPSLIFGSLFIQIFYAVNAALFVLFFSKSFDVVEIMDTYGYCDFIYPQYVQQLSIFWGLAYLWTILFVDHMRLSVIAAIVGSWHFHPEDMPSMFLAIKNTFKSFGTLSVSSLIATIAEKVNRMMSRGAYTSCLTPLIFVTWPLECLMCIFGKCIHACVKMFTNFAVVLHVFTGDTFIGSAKHAFNILSRHFKDGFVTEITSRSLFSLASYAFSFCVALITWVWINAEFDCNSLPRDGTNTLWILYFIVILFSLYYPVLGLYGMILANRFLRQYEKEKMILLEAGQTDDFTSAEDWEENLQPTNHFWIPPLAATFVGCIAMMFFEFVSNIFLDIITTLFLCFAIDKDNEIDTEGSEFDILVQQMPQYLKYDQKPVDNFNDDETGPARPVVPIIPTAIPVQTY